MRKILAHDHLAKALPELITLERILEKLRGRAQVNTVATILCDKLTFPIYTIILGSSDPTAPTLGIFGGVHGLERIGSQVVLSYLQTVTELLGWDEMTAEILSRARLVFMPLVNPAGMYLQRRSNPNGVDLMRNSPEQGEGIPAYHLFSGHRLSRHLPWYRGEKGAPMEPEAQALCDFVSREIFSSKLAVVVDVHSGYGAVDRLWFPYAKTRQPYPNLAEMLALRRLLDRTYPNHVYHVEPQSNQYQVHGDLWDFLYDERRKTGKPGLFFPLTLEMGAWIWIRKSYRQLFSLFGAFNPIALHRQQRTLRRHLLLFGFLHRAVLSGGIWAHMPETDRERLQQEAMDIWYEA